MAKEEEKKVVEPKAVLVEVPTQTTLLVRLPDGREISDLGLLVEIYNDIQKIKKSV